MHHIGIQRIVLFSLLFAGVGDLRAASIIHDFEGGSYDGITVKNATPSLENGDLKLNISEANNSMEGKTYIQCKSGHL